MYTQEKQGLLFLALFYSSERQITQNLIPFASRNYLDDHVLGRMNGSQEAKALQGLFVGTNLGMGFVTKGKKKEQVIRRAITCYFSVYPNR